MRQNSTYNVKEQDGFVEVRVAFSVLDDLGLDNVSSNFKFNARRGYAGKLEFLHVSDTPTHDLKLSKLLYESIKLQRPTSKCQEIHSS